jgi:iron complex transport system substrate-binding protein
MRIEAKGMDAHFRCECRAARCLLCGQIDGTTRSAHNGVDHLHVYGGVRVADLLPIFKWHRPLLCVILALIVRNGLSIISLAAVLAFNIAASAAAELAHKPIRIVSINLCTDELVLRLADPKNVASVTYLSRSEYSNVIDLAEKIPVNHGLAEEIVPLNPDLVVSGIHTGRPAVALLRRSNIPILDLDVPRTIQEVLNQYRDVGESLGEPERAKQIVDEMEERLAAMSSPPPPPLLHALVFNANNFTSGKRSLKDDIITRAGMENLARTFGIEDYDTVPLEKVVWSKVDVLILSPFRDVPAIATEALRHPVLQAISDRTRLTVMPSKLWVCAGPENVDAINLLSRVATEVRREAARR